MDEWKQNRLEEQRTPPPQNEKRNNECKYIDTLDKLMETRQIS